MRWPRPVVCSPQRGQLRLIRLLRMRPERLACRLERMAHCVSLSLLLAVLRTMTCSPLRRLQELAAVCGGLALFASDEGGESGGLPVRVQSTRDITTAVSPDVGP